jgi:HEAT repeat protein
MRKLLVVGAMLAVAGCYNDPNDAKTWIKKLDDIRDQKEAVRQLVKLKDKSAVQPLMDLYKKTHDPEHLKAIASFADPTSVPVLIDALDYSEDSFDAASVAATALGEIGDKSAVDGLIKAVQKPLSVKTRANVVKLESMKSLAKIKDPRGVDALIKVLTTSADDQDFFLNQVAAKSLGAFGDPKAVPALVRGLFMQGRGANIFQECRTSLILIGESAVEPLLAAMNHKNEDLELDAKKYEFIPGIIEQKCSMVLGDLHSKKAIPGLLEVLKKPDEGMKAGPGKGVSGHQSVILALGLIGGPDVLKPLLEIVNDVKRPPKHRMSAAEALNALGDQAALPSLAKLAQTKFINEKSKEIDPEAFQVMAGAATAYSRIADENAPTPPWPKLPADLEESEAHMVIKSADARIALAKECKKEVACYAKAINDKDPAKAEKAAIMLGRLGKPGLAELVKHVGDADLSVRMSVLFGIGRAGDKSCAECFEAIDKQLDRDKGKTGDIKATADEARAVRAMISH